MRSPSSSVTRAWLLAITLGAFGLRVFRLGAQSLWYDEGVTAAIAQRGLAELTRWTANDIQPPLYYYVVSAWGRLAGWSEWSLRYPSAFFGALAIPLLAALTFTLTRRRSAALLAALFAASHPLLVYYSQEARMYAMLIALCILLGVIVVRLELRRRTTLQLTLYVVVAVAAIYTHYFAFFVLAALGIAFYVSQLLLIPRLEKRDMPESPVESAMQTRSWRLLGGFLLANVAVIVLYLPWLNTLVTRLNIDASYWEGIFKLQDAQRHIAVSFIGGETMREEQAAWLIAPMLLVTLFLFAVLVWRNPKQYRTALYAAAWTIAPITGVLLLASFAPKFNARYVMIALPGLIVLWSAGLTQLGAPIQWRRDSTAAKSSTRLQRIAAIALILYFCGQFAFATYSWYEDSALHQGRMAEAGRLHPQRPGLSGRRIRRPQPVHTAQRPQLAGCGTTTRTICPLFAFPILRFWT